MSGFSVVYCVQSFALTKRLQIPFGFEKPEKEFWKMKLVKDMSAMVPVY